MKKIWLSLFAAFILVLGGCSETTNETNSTNDAASSENQSQQEENTLTTKITLTDENGEVISEDTVEFEEGESLMEVMDQNYELITGYEGAFIFGIDGVGSEEESKDYWWKITVNGEDLMVGANDYILEENDEVHFTYTKVE